ncbi:MAG: hypothetical protein IPH33_15495 [Bacteroidetes bacterium]|nr:hypothetical protein [Bacteroidota bacterium]
MNNPLIVAANILLPLKASSFISNVDKPEFTEVQVFPESADKKTPFPFPAKILLPVIIIDLKERIELFLKSK